MKLWCKNFFVECSGDEPGSSLVTYVQSIALTTTLPTLIQKVILTRSGSLLRQFLG